MVYLMWRFPAEHNQSPIIYTLAYKPWWVYFSADDGYDPGKGLNRINDRGVYTTDDYILAHDVPTLTPTVAYLAVQFIPRLRS